MPTSKSTKETDSIKTKKGKPKPGSYEAILKAIEIGKKANEKVTWIKY